MTTIYADYNARTRDDRVRLTTVGSRKSLATAGVGPGAWVWLSDGEVRSGAVIEDSEEGLVAHVAWETAEDVVDQVTAAAAAAAVHELQAMMQGTERDYRRLLRSLPMAERALDAGRGDYYRSRAAQAFGYPHLALLAIEDALQRAPERPGFVNQRLELLKTIDLDRAYGEARALTERDIPALVIAACASIYNGKARQLDEAGAATVETALLKFTEGFDSSSGYDVAPRSVASMVYVTRGFAFLRLGDRTRALAEFDRAVTANPDKPEALAARGLETYPGQRSVADLLRAVELGFSAFWPTYYLSHHFVSERDWPRAERFAGAALAMDPPNRIRANLIEWQAIARFQQDGDAAKARNQLRDAVAIAPDNEHLQKNLHLVEDLLAPSSSDTPWVLVRDAETQTLDLAA